MQQVVVTGGAGFIGSHLCARLLRDGYQVTCIDNLITGSKDNLKTISSDPNFTFLEHNVIQPLPDSVTADIVFHLASPASPNHHSPISYHALPMETMEVNTTGTHRMLEFAKKQNAKFLFSSTSEIYGDPLEHPQKEEYRGNVSTIGPRSVYDEAKRFGETLTSYYYRTQGVDGRIARIFNTYGPNMSRQDMRMVIIMISQALENKPITVFGDGKQTRCLCYVDDLIEGLMKLMFTDGTRGQVVNLGATVEHTVYEYATIIKQLTKSTSEIVLSEDLPEDDPKKRRPDITKAKTLLSWRPKVNLEVGLQKTIAYFKSL